MSRVHVINPAELPAPVGTYSQVAVDSVTGFIVIAGQVGIDPHTGELPASAAAQCMFAVRHAISAVTASGGSPDTILRMTAYLADKRNIPAYRSARNAEYQRLGLRVPPPHMLVVVAALGRDDYAVEVDALAVCASDG